MPKPDILNIRDRLEMRIVHLEKSLVFDVRIQDMNDDGFYVDRPIIDATIVAFNKKQKVMLTLARKEANFIFDSEILGETSLGHLPVIFLSYPKEVKKVQRRQHFRLELEIPLFFRRIIPSIAGASDDLKKATIIDLSAGGVKFTTSAVWIKSLLPGDDVSLNFNLSKQFSIRDLYAKVLQTNIDDNDRLKAVVICRFKNIPKNIQEAIVIHNIRFMQKFKIEKNN